MVLVRAKRNALSRMVDAVLRVRVVPVLGVDTQVIAPLCYRHEVQFAGTVERVEFLQHVIRMFKFCECLLFGASAFFRGVVERVAGDDKYLLVRPCAADVRLDDPGHVADCSSDVRVRGMNRERQVSRNPAAHPADPDNPFLMIEVKRDGARILEKLVDAHGVVLHDLRQIGYDLASHVRKPTLNPSANLLLVQADAFRSRHGVIRVRRAAERDFVVVRVDHGGDRAKLALPGSLDAPDRVEHVIARFRVAVVESAASKTLVVAPVEMPGHEKQVRESRAVRPSDPVGDLVHETGPGRAEPSAERAHLFDQPERRARDFGNVESPVHAPRHQYTRRMSSPVLVAFATHVRVAVRSHAIEIQDERNDVIVSWCRR